MTQTIERRKWHTPRFDYQQRWWQINYGVLRKGIVGPSRHILRYDARLEGTLPSVRPLMLVPVHRTSVDIYAISYFVNEFVSFISTDTFGHGRLANALQRHLTTALGSVVWKQSGITNRRARALALSRDVERRLDSKKIVAVFTQGKYEANSVDSYEDGILGLLRRYETRARKRVGTFLRIPIVPVGLEYDYCGKGLVQSRFADRLARFLPALPRWQVPALGSRITVRFGEAQYLGDQTTAELAASLMRDAAALSNIPYRVVDAR